MQSTRKNPTKKIFRFLLLVFFQVNCLFAGSYQTRGSIDLAYLNNLNILNSSFAGVDYKNNLAIYFNYWNWSGRSQKFNPDNVAISGFYTLGEENKTTLGLDFLNESNSIIAENKLALFLKREIYAYKNVKFNVGLTLLGTNFKIDEERLSDYENNNCWNCGSFIHFPNRNVFSQNISLSATSKIFKVGISTLYSNDIPWYSKKYSIYLFDGIISYAEYTFLAKRKISFTPFWIMEFGSIGFLNSFGIKLNLFNQANLIGGISDFNGFIGFNWKIKNQFNVSFMYLPSSMLSPLSYNQFGASYTSLPFE